ncbi:UDP-glucose dehydrogenase family protein [Streptomyces sp. NPDC059740]|uniref:UDP-glucose dehydrogenase family protein n=1 Tax=Streptomyces sp. NPDC059740 TaxID=3346926 RepID=UPI003658BBB4
MRVAVMGQGYVGLTGAIALAEQGHDVVGVERDPGRLSMLRAGTSPIYEPGVPEALARLRGSGRLVFAADTAAEHRRHPFDIVLVTVGTPPGPDGAADLTQVRSALDQVAALDPTPSVVLKSTVPPGTSALLLDTYTGLRDTYAYSPEFLNQGSALEDWRTPSRIVAGLWSQDMLPLLRALYGDAPSPWVVTTPTSAEMVKYASNAFLATKISFANEMARLCAQPDVHVDDVMRGAGHDPRIGDAFLRPGLGFGDSCLPKDTSALRRWAADLGIPTPLLDATTAVNAAQPALVVDMLREEFGPALAAARVAVLGVRYEPWSDDIRAAPSGLVIPELTRLAGEVRVWDPAMDLPTLNGMFPGTVPAASLHEAVHGSQALVVLTEWPEVVGADWRALTAGLAEPHVVIDGKNCLPPQALAGLAVRYRGMGTRLVPTAPAPVRAPDRKLAE